ncbi:hypothetical protein PPERSA_03214 [Pseudocohnilembus persalinus]|uniref:PIPK domain-containing protein n=1 Tax=Pseudocohnilembus persalinus TaxID=266149 RepID=A0A0V0QE48_PSEPJ|nr:hypothetical protein PPERSA_03214 [Pseudocohnilembus persalinus]|eukprot:KRX00481.1 hypothetical protein PPERSA_03214 [Pseudocohnilembus persalinus]
MYGEDHLLDCSRLDEGQANSYTQEDISEILTIFPLDRVIILVLGFFSCLSSLFIMVTFYKYKECRKQPGDIILAISISELILNIHWISMTLFDWIQGQGPLSQSDFCQIESAFSISAGTSEFIYNILFCYFHVLAIISIICVYLFCLITKQTGLSLFGMCSFKQGNNFGVLGLLIVVVYLIFSIFTIIYFRKQIPDNEDLKHYRNTFLNYYYTYVIAQSIIWTVLAFSNLVVGLNCTGWQVPKLNIFITIGNTSKLCTSIVLSIIRYKDPVIRSQIRPILEQKLPCLFKTKADNEKQLIIEGSQINNTTFDESSERKVLFFDKLSETLRMSQIYSMICGIVSAQKQAPQTPSLSYQDLSRNDCTERFKFQLSDSYIKGIACLNMENKTDKLNVQKYDVTMYAPKIFKSFIEVDRRMVNLEKSFNIVDNFQSIQSKFSGDGGRSGSFFYMTTDKKMMMKSMTNSEKDIMIEKLYQYTQHFGENEDSLISKIYGIFTFQLGNQKEHILIMRNIQNCPDQYKIRSYDLKGSTVDRQVLKANLKPEQREEYLLKKTLKDTDFQEVEKNGKVNIDPALQQKISEILIKDAQFFMEQMKVMDYSLLILKVNWSQYAIDNNIDEKEEIKKRFSDELACIPSTLEPGTYYQMVIIDYLQVWNPNKVVEQQFKKFKNVNFNLDVSAQDPVKYGNRFIQNIAKKLFIEE